MSPTGAPDRADRVAVASGRAYRIASPPGSGMVTRELASHLERVLERFAGDAGYDQQRPVPLVFKPGVVGHHKVGRAIDIYAVAGQGLDTWKRRWDDAIARAGRAESPAARQTMVERARKENIGWRLYKALQQHGRWAQPYGYPIQLFGPWTRSEGPWRYISEPLLRAHLDHIHVAK